jgi:hypothetical protein
MLTSIIANAIQTQDQQALSIIATYSKEQQYESILDK